MKPDSKELRGFPADLELPAEKDPQEPEVCQAKTARRAGRGPQELLGLQEPPGPPVTQAPQENRENWAHRVLLEAKARKVNGATFSRRHPSRPSPGRSVSS